MGAHHALIEGNYSQTSQGLCITVVLGVYFTMLQGLEYYEARFTFADRVYETTFFIATGFHGLARSQAGRASTHPSLHGHQNLHALLSCVLVRQQSPHFQHEHNLIADREP